MKALRIAICLSCLTAIASATDLYVSPGGSDTNPGTADQPLATLAGARGAIRTVKAQGPLTEPVGIRRKPGQAEQHRLEPCAPYRLGRIERHGRHLYARAVPGHPGPP